MQGAVDVGGGALYIPGRLPDFFSALSHNQIHTYSKETPHSILHQRHDLDSMGPGRLTLAMTALLLQSIDAAPQSERSINRIPRELGNILAPTTIGVFFCPEAFWDGDCQYLENGPGLCSEKSLRSLLLSTL